MKEKTFKTCSVVFQKKKEIVQEFIFVKTVFQQSKRGQIIINMLYEVL